MASYYIVNEHEKIYRELDTIKHYMDNAMAIFENVEAKEIDILRQQAYNHADALRSLFEEGK
jgi:hypothetical protein